ncbi:MAG: hypothetical protein PVI23_09180 [Maricaulaceae bacterium]|jgi:hypothetical protein
MADVKRVPITVRLRPGDKEVFVEAAEKCGLEPSIAARQVLELLVMKLKRENNLLSALLQIQQTLDQDERKSA